MTNHSRRQWLLGASASFFGAVGWNARSGADERPQSKKTCTLSIGTYSMKGIPLEKAIGSISALGYDGIEIAVMQGFGAEPAQLGPDRRKDVRRLLADQRLRLTALMEHLVPATDDKQHKSDLDRLRRTVELAHSLAPDRPPLVQTVLGGGKWEEKKDLFRDRLDGWLAVARDARVVLAIKPHRGGAMSRPEEAIWLIRQLKEPPWLRMVYDYSHYAFRDMPLDETVRTALPFTAHVAVKDAVQKDGRVEFLLPGESSTFDYAKLLRLLYEGGYHADICCEVSSMVSSKPGYDPALAAKTCYQNMARAFKEARVPRG
jgi:inosose dehydratase